MLESRITDLELSAQQFQPEFVPESQTSEQQQQMPELCGGVGAASWSHPGDGHKRKDCLLLLLQSTGMRQEQEPLQQLLAVVLSQGQSQLGSRAQAVTAGISPGGALETSPGAPVDAVSGEDLRLTL